MLGIGLGFAASLSWGLADFLGGLVTRRIGAFAVLAVSQTTGFALVVALALAAGGATPAVGEAWPAAVAGLVGLIALASLYRALAIGTMSIVAPISATGAIVPVVVGIATGDRPSAFQLVGIAVAIGGVVLASRERHDDEQQAAAGRQAVLLALVAAVGFGTFFVCIDAAADDLSVPWTMLVARCAVMVPLVLLVIVGVGDVRPAAGRVWQLVGIGVFDVGANLLYAAASTSGLLSVVSVLASLYPAVTVLLARTFLHERLRRIQGAGVLLAFAGVVLIAAG